MRAMSAVFKTLLPGFARRSQIVAIVIAALVVCLGAGLARPSSAPAAVSLTSPVDGARYYDDEPITFDWVDVAESIRGSVIQLRPSFGPVTITYRSYAGIALFDAGTFSVGPWLWRACELTESDVVGSCSAERGLQIVAAPTLNRATAMRHARSRLKRSWRARHSSGRCVRDSDLLYSCKMNWRSRRVKYKGMVTVSLIDHQFETDAWVTSRRRLK